METKTQSLSHECLIEGVIESCTHLTSLGMTLGTQGDVRTPEFSCQCQEAAQWVFQDWNLEHMQLNTVWKPYFLYLNCGLNLTFFFLNMYGIICLCALFCQEKLIVIHMLKFTSKESKSNYNSEICFILLSEKRGPIEIIKEEHIFRRTLFPCCSEMEGSCYMYWFEDFLKFL